MAVGITYPTWKYDTDAQHADAIAWRKNRPEGFYFVQVDKDAPWHPANWRPEDDETWMVAGYAEDMSEEDLYAIDERRLEYAQLGPVPAQLGHSFADALLAKLVERDSAIVGTAVCSRREIEDATKRGDLYVDRDGYGFVLRLRAWLDAVQVLQGHLQPPDEPEQEGTS